MFSFKRTKGRHNIRRKDAAAADEDAADSGAADIVKRSAKPGAKQRGVATAAGLGGGSGSAAAEDAGPEGTQPAAAGVAERAGAYPFSTDGIPDSQQIYMAKKLRRERQAAQRMGGDGAEGEGEKEEEEDFIRLSDDMESSRLDGPGEEDTLGDIAVEGEDEHDAVIVDKAERAEFNRVARMAMDESIAQAHSDRDDDWESAQLRSAGVPALPRAAGEQPRAPEDEGFELDREQLRFMLAQEEGQLAVEEERLTTARKRLAAAEAALEDLGRQIEHAQKQYDRFLALTKAAA
ncbi:hypothetical protein H4R18_001767 [Coemansia javaensis]|uniref:Uncharacterized protein n=1 Tax=Coemansia javaensis TaxID=2761396 RepID=A0A9W8LK49_9FUNG|nr:hypothetical protein H4R18_001767 [Coemansia javaensis]